MTVPRIIAHRGFAEQYPENTVRAVRRSARRADMLEIDVQPCGTGELVVFHDEELDRLTEATGRVDETPLSRLRELDVAGSGEPIPTLSEVLAVVPADVRLNLELKVDDPTVVERAIRCCEAAGVDVVYSSFRDGAVREVRRRRPDADVAVLCHRSQSVVDRLALADDLDAVAFHPSFALVDGWDGTPTPDVDAPADAAVDVTVEGQTVETDADVVALARSLGFTVNVWTVPDADAVARLAARGVDGVMVDSIDAVPADVR